ncbi:MAG TPA: TetR/AcrR family transcriptional regulator [Gaiellaceae bacterium]
MTATRARLTAEQRRAAVLDTASAIFAKGSYRGTTTAEIARQAGVTEPILYRHFASKRDLYLACLENAWTLCREMWEGAVVGEEDPALWVAAMGRSYLEARDRRPLIANLWVQALTEASDDAEIRKYLKRHMREVQEFVAGVIRRSQEANGVPQDRDADAEAWIFISIGLLATVSKRLGGMLDEEFPRIVASRRRWMTGRDT